MGENNFFGGGEYYLGMMSGVVRYACMLMFVLALLNAPYYSAADIKATEAYNEPLVRRRHEGYSGNYFPDVANRAGISVFKESFIGPYIKDNLGMLLIKTASADSEATNRAQKPAVINIRK